MTKDLPKKVATDYWLYPKKLNFLDVFMSQAALQGIKKFYDFL